MNATHIHLLITHLPVFGSLLGAMILFYGLWTRNNQVKIAAYGVFILSAIGAVIAFNTGEGAEESVEHLAGVVENTIESHEESADFAFGGSIILGVISLFALFVTLKNSAISRTLAVVVLFIALITFGLVARTAYLGGQIRHTEINTSNTNTNGEPEQEHEDED